MVLEKLKTAWEWLDGKKTTIGALFMLVSQILRVLGVNEWADFMDQITETLGLAGSNIALVGLLHKAKKQVN